jgi:hypothetical protein
MEADRGRRVYRVSHVDDGVFMVLLRRTHVKHYDFATATGWLAPPAENSDGSTMVAGF